MAYSERRILVSPNTEEEKGKKIKGQRVRAGGL